MGEDGKPVIAQLRFFDSDGALIKRIQTDIDGNFEILLDEGHYNLEVSKGYEYEMKQLPIEVKKENPLNLKSISLTRLMDWTAKSYLCGDLHQHSQFLFQTPERNLRHFSTILSVRMQSYWTIQLPLHHLHIFQSNSL